ncbi:MAG: prolyl oligopeptidase family serine peptidase [Terriglobales bacterium]
MPGGLRLLSLSLSLVVLAAALRAADDSSTGTTAPEAPPKARVDSVVDTIHGHRIGDPYRWLEDAASPDTQEFVRQELAYTRGILDPLPGREQIHQRLSQLLLIGTIDAPQAGGPYYFYTRRDGTQNQPVLLVREGIHGKDRTLVDVNQMAADGTVALDWWYPSDDGTFVAYGTSAGGSEVSTLRVIKTSSGELLPDIIERTRAASLAWKLDNSGFYYTRYPKKGEVPAGQEVYNRHVFCHTLGSDPAADSLIFGADLGPEDWPNLTLSNDGRWLLISVSHGWTKTELYLSDLHSKSVAPVRITEGKEFLYGGDVFKGKLYITSNEDAPRFHVFVADASKPQREHWKEIIPQSDAVLNGVSVLGGKLFAQYEKNASSLLKLFELDGKAIADIPLPTLGTVSGVGGRWDRKEVFVNFSSFTVPPSVYQVDLPSQRSELWDKVGTPGVDPAAYEVKQLWYASKDGTKVPMFVFHKKGLALDGRNPTLLTGYGGFNVSNTPEFRSSRFVWLEHGGVFAVANLRGGSEFGEDWHRAGMLEKKQNVFDDFTAAAEFLISQKYTDKDHLAIQGGSNGGLLMGAAFTQRPDLYRAVVCQVPLLDMLRYQNFQIAKLWIPEYGSADDPKQFDWLYAYSPYHQVKAGTEYPSILFVTADTDTRVDPMHAKKMAALMQAEAANGQSRTRPILLRIETKAGHGQGKPITKQIEESTDVYSYLFWQLGVKE